jgi:hypothetical protein
MHRSKKQLKSLQDKWYKKLKDSGFDDIEYQGHGTDFLNLLRPKWKTTNSSQVRQPSSEGTFEGIRDYYIYAEHFLNEPYWELEKKVWQLHAEGKSIRETAKDLNISVFTTRTLLTRGKRQFSIYLRERLNEDSN